VMAQSLANREAALEKLRVVAERERREAIASRSFAPASRMQSKAPISSPKRSARARR